jgi:hypothetical protein
MLTEEYTKEYTEGCDLRSTTGRCYGRSHPYGNPDVSDVFSLDQPEDDQPEEPVALARLFMQSYSCAPKAQRRIRSWFRGQGAALPLLRCNLCRITGARPLP